MVLDQRGPASKLRRLTTEELWRCQGRGAEQLRELVRQGYGVEHVLEEGNGGPNCCLAGYLLTRDGHKAGGCFDKFGDESTTKLLRWLLMWKRGLLPRADPGRRAGGRCDDQRMDEVSRVVWLWGKALWLDESDSEPEDEAEFVVDEGDDAALRSRRSGRRWLAIRRGTSHRSTARLAPLWINRAWAMRQGWPSEFLSKSVAVETNEDKLLGFLGYLGWLGCTVATLKQVVFAVKDARKKFGHGDPTEAMDAHQRPGKALRQEASKAGSDPGDDEVDWSHAESKRGAVQWRAL